MAELNPFADPAVREITRTEQQSTITVLDTYNPFSDDTTKSTIPVKDISPSTTVTIAQSVPVAPSTTVQQQPPAYNQSSVQSATDDLIKRQQELEKRAAEITRREQELNTQFYVRRNNFPPLPERCCIQPCFYQDISVEIPPQFQRTVRFVFYVWIFYCVVLLLNVIAAFAYLVSSIMANRSNRSPATLGLSIVYLFLYSPCFFIGWFRRGYSGFRSDSSINFFVHFIFSVIKIALAIFGAIGVDGTGKCGWLVAFRVMNYNLIVGIMMCVVAALFTILACLFIVMLIKVLYLYRSTGASFAEARAEFRTDVMGRKGTQQAVGNMAGSAVLSAVAAPPEYRI